MTHLEVQVGPQMPREVPSPLRGGSTPEDLAMGRYADGDERAFDEVFAALASRLQAFLRRLCGSDELAHDLTQETFLRMHRARASFAPNGAVVPWAYAIARNCYVSHTRSRQAKVWRTSVTTEGREFATGVDACVEEAASAQQRARIVEQTLAAMSPASREAFILVRFEGQSIAEAAQILGTTEGAVKQRAFQAYERLREALSLS